MSHLDVHPATRLIAWIALLIAVQCLSGGVLALALVGLPLCGARIRRRGARLAWRARWLLLSLIVIFSWGVAGDPLWDGAWAPTVAGCRDALTHAARLLLVLFTVAAFLEAMPIADLLAATHVVLRPARLVGLDADRAVVRLMLVLRYVETLPRPRDWRVLLDAPVASVCERVEVSDRPLQSADYLIVVVLVALLATAVSFWGA